MVHRLGTALWRTAFALFLLVASLVVFPAPAEASLQRFAVEICDAPDGQDVPFLSRQESGDDRGPSTTKWTPRTPVLIALEREMFLIQLLEQPSAHFLDPPILRSTLLENPTARGPPGA